MADEIKVTKRKLTDYRPDTKNANRGSLRGKQMIKTSFEENGAGRSLLADADGNLIAGNQSFEGAAAAGITDVIEIETEGEAVVVVRRRDLKLDSDDQRARRLAIADNRTNEVSLTWSPDELLADRSLLEGMFREDEIDALLAAGDAEKEVEAALDSEGGEKSDRAMGDRKKQIKPVLYADEIAVFEQALRATNINNRGQALMTVCRFYLDKQGVQDERPDSTVVKPTKA
jgi:hypothetical protein